MIETQGRYEPPLYGSNPEGGLVGVEHVERASGPDEMTLWIRRGEATDRRTEPFTPFIVAAGEVMAGCPVPCRQEPLGGPARLNRLALFRTWKESQKAKAWLSRTTGLPPAASEAPYLAIGDPVQQHLTMTGRTLFRDLAFEALRRMQVDIECVTSEGYEFCNPAREGDRIVMIAARDWSGGTTVLSGAAMDEKALLEGFVSLIGEKDPDVIEGHNIFNFDLPYIARRASMHGVTLALGRDGSAPGRRPGRFSAGERTIAYERFDIVGRHVVNTLFLAHAYDVTHRSLDGFGLKEVAVHFGVAAPDRTYLDGSRIGEEFRNNPARVMAYVRDDVRETGELSNLLSRSSFIQAQILPLSYQNVCVRGSAAKIDALLLREYLRQRHAVPMPDAPREFSGGYTDVFVHGVVRNVHHCDIRSLYPSLMLAGGIAPRSDALGVFLSLLKVLRAFRLESKRRQRESASREEATYYDALQTTFKILINSFYGYLAFPQARFSDFDAAERIAGEGRALLRAMIDWLRARGASPVEIDTDGIYFVPPAFDARESLDAFRADFARMLPEGIEVDFDGVYRSMYSYRMKNYALLTDGGEIVIKGAALKSRGLEPFLRAFLREMIRMELEGRAGEIPALKEKYVNAIRNREWPIERLAKTETLQDAPATYAGKIGKGGRGRNAAYELALAGAREYRAGDQLSYYVSGEKKSVAVHEKARMVSDWNPEARDENIAYYEAKLEALYEKFQSAADEQSELDL